MAAVRKTTRKSKRKVGRPKGVMQSAAAKKKIALALKKYWNSAEGKKRRKTARKSVKKTAAATPRKKSTRKVKLHYRTVKRNYAPKRGRPKGSKNKTTRARKAVAKRRPMA